MLSIFNLALALLLFASLGLVLSTVGAPFLAAALTLLFPIAREKTASTRPGPFTLDILIPAHNEEALIQATLQSVVEAGLRVLASREGVQVRISVALDHCTDRTAAVLEDFSKRCPLPLRWTENSSSAGKWNALALLLNQSDAEWVAFVDSGSLWDPELLQHALPHFEDTSVMGVAPSYSPLSAGKLDRWIWRLERTLKSIENRAGGPVSVHGASVFYRRNLVAATHQSLSQMNPESTKMWKNDDVVLPLLLRLSHPGLKIVYLPEVSRQGGRAWVQDRGIRPEIRTEYRRRQRMLAGNVEWIREILLPRLMEKPMISLLASRRVFRTFWAYWALFTAMGALLLAMAILPAALIWPALGLGWMIWMVSRKAFEKLAVAFWVGLQVPLALRGNSQLWGSSWK